MPTGKEEPGLHTQVLDQSLFGNMPLEIEGFDVILSTQKL
jgi:hypothetical protein